MLQRQKQKQKKKKNLVTSSCITISIYELRPQFAKSQQLFKEI